MMGLSKADLEKLAAEPSPETRAELVRELAADYNAGVFTPTEKTLANEIFRLLLRDAEERIRRVLADYLHMNLEIPHDIAIRLAKDKTDVALPMLEYSYVLSEEDLIEIVRSTRELARLKAVARRHSISQPLSAALMDTREEEVIQTLLENKGASIDEEKIHEMLAMFERHPSLLEALVMRGRLSIGLAEKLFVIVSDDLKKTLSQQYYLSRSVTDDALDTAREWTMLELLPSDAPLGQVEQLVDHLFDEQKLTYSVIIRALCLGELRFFEMAMARLANIPVINARMLMLDPGPLGFKALYDISALPDGFYQAIRTLHHVAMEETGFGAYKRGDYKRRIIQRLISGGYDQSVENMPYLLSLIGGVSESAAVH